MLNLYLKPVFSIKSKFCLRTNLPLGDWRSQRVIVHPPIAPILGHSMLSLSMYRFPVRRRCMLPRLSLVLLRRRSPWRWFPRVSRILEGYYRFRSLPQRLLALPVSRRSATSAAISTGSVADAGKVTTRTTTPGIPRSF